MTPTLLSNARDLSHDFINISITIIVVSIIIVPMSHISRIITFTSSQWPRCQDNHHLHQRQPCYRPGVQPMSSCDAGSPGPVFAVDHFLPHFIIIIVITLIIIWSNTVLPVHNMMVSLARRCHGRLRDGEASFFGRRRYQRTKSHSSANNIHWTCPNRGAVCVVNATSDP